MNVHDARELGRVLIEAGEIETLIDWIEGETRLVYRETGRVLADPDAAPEERRRASSCTGGSTKCSRSCARSPAWSLGSTLPGHT